MAHCFGIPARYIQLLILVFGYAVNNALLLMLNGLTTDTFGYFKDLSSSKTKFSETVDGFTKQNLYILRILYRITSPFTCLLAGILALKVNNKYLFLLVVMVESICSYLSPIVVGEFKVLGAGCILFIASILKGMSIPPLYGILSKWIPSTERCRSLAVVFGIGELLGLVTIYSQRTLASVIAPDNIYYFMGTVGTVWSICWFIFGAQDPNTCFFITETETNILFSSLKHYRQPSFKAPIPWKAVLTCMPMYGVMAANFATQWAMSLFSNIKFITNFFSTMTKHDPHKAMEQLVLYYLWSPFIMILTAYGCDKLSVYLLWSANNFRKTVNSISLWGAAICISFICYYSGEIVFTFCSVAIYLLGCGHFAGFKVALFDLSPTYICLTAGVIMVPINLCLIIQPYILTTYLDEVTKISYYDYCLYLVIFLLYVGNGIFLMCGVIELQSFDSVGSVPCNSIGFYYLLGKGYLSPRTRDDRFSLKIMRLQHESLKAD